MNFGLIYDLLFAVVGFYVLSLYMKVSQSGDLNDIRKLLPKKLKLEECLDSAAFFSRIKPWILAFGASVILTGAVGAMEDLKLGMPHAVYLAALGLCIAAAAAFVINLRRAVEKFWELEEEEDEPPRPPRLGRRR